VTIELRDPSTPGVFSDTDLGTDFFPFQIGGISMWASRRLNTILPCTSTTFCMPIALQLHGTYMRRESDAESGNRYGRRCMATSAQVWSNALPVLVFSGSAGLLPRICRAIKPMSARQMVAVAQDEDKCQPRKKLLSRSAHQDKLKIAHPRPSPELSKPQWLRTMSQQESWQPRRRLASELSGTIGRAVGMDNTVLKKSPSWQ
jgi:hypothetical protein